MKRTKILDCTLRDGSYALDFRFTEADTERIGSALDKAGFAYIEVGHGIGLGASEQSQYIAAASDKEYLQAASRSIAKAKWGMFCIPGIANLDHLRMAADFGIDFIRVGTNVDEVDQSAPFIELAHDLGIQVFSNFMKSYALDPVGFAKLAKHALSLGTELIYLVDSAGGMLPSEILSYIHAARAEVSDIPLGFHGHNNLGLAVANTLVCIEEGVELVDTSLQGFGRSAGNTPTEQLLSVLTRSGYKTVVDPIVAMDLGETLIRTLIEKRGISSLDIVSGQALFHSSYMPIILRTAKRYRIDPRRLIIEICKYDKVSVPEDLLNKLAHDLQHSYEHLSALPWSNYFGEEEMTK